MGHSFSTVSIASITSVIHSQGQLIHGRLSDAAMRFGV